MITYKNFIDEIRRLAAEGKKLRNAGRMHEDPGFRKWRNELGSVLSQIVQVDYLLPCSVQAHNRRFGYSTRITTTDEELMAAYRRDMDDTINELTVIVESFDRHGEPPKGGKASAGLEMPKVITAFWLFHHAPITFLLKVGTVAIAIFSIGVYVGQTELYRKAVSLFTTTQNQK